MNKYQNYLENVGNCSNPQELSNLICQLGLYFDDRLPYGEYSKYMIPNQDNVEGGLDDTTGNIIDKSKTGLWQNPLELAYFLFTLKQHILSRNIVINSFLEIGTFTGYSFFIIFNFIKTHINESVKGTTIDINDYCCHDIDRYISGYKFRGNINNLLSSNNEKYDLVFIDGNHAYPHPMNDFNSVQQTAKIIFFHDIVGPHTPGVVETFNVLKERYEHFTVCMGDIWFGIGAIFL